MDSANVPTDSDTPAAEDPSAGQTFTITTEPAWVQPAVVKPVKYSEVQVRKAAQKKRGEIQREG